MTTGCPYLSVDIGSTTYIQEFVSDVVVGDHIACQVCPGIFSYMLPIQLLLMSMAMLYNAQHFAAFINF